VVTGLIEGASPADQLDVGTIYLRPVDGNTNGLGDDWEEIYFGTNGVDGLADTDGDGLKNGEEYMAGTNPTDGQSVLKPEGVVGAGGDEWILRWPVAPGRSYCVWSTDSLMSDDPGAPELGEGGWSLCAGPWTAVVGQVEMEWNLPDPVEEGTRYYRIELVE